MELSKLSEYFPPEKIEWRIGATNKEKTSGVALAYVTNRAIQDRLDEVCGPQNWKNEYLAWKGEHQLCGISIRVGDEWITKWDGAENTQVEPLKGGLSAAMKRAAAQWGIGRYLYDLPAEWYPIVPFGKSFKFDSKKLPKLPEKFLPAGCKNEGYQIDATTDDENRILSLKKEQQLSKQQIDTLGEIILLNGIELNDVLKWGNVKELAELTIEQYSKIIEVYSSRPDTKMPSAVITEFEKKRLAEINAKVGKQK